MLNVCMNESKMRPSHTCTHICTPIAHVCVHMNAMCAYTYTNGSHAEKQGLPPINASLVFDYTLISDGEISLWQH